MEGPIEIGNSPECRLYLIRERAHWKHDYHDKLCYYLVHIEFALLHDRMLHEKERTQFPIVFLVGKINRFCLRNILHVINCCLIFTYHLECLYEISKKKKRIKKMLFVIQHWRYIYNGMMNEMWIRQSPRGSFLKYSWIEEHQCSYE